MDRLEKCVCCAYPKRRNVTKVGWPTEKRTFRFHRGRRISSPQEFALHAEQRLETALRCFPKLEKNWMRQLTTSNYWDWKECANPLILIHFFVIWLCKSLSVINILLKTLTSWAQREKTVQDKVTFMHEHKENCLELFKSRRHFGELSWTT